MNEYSVIGYIEKTGERKVLFMGLKSDCINWIWENCDIGDLHRSSYRRWSGLAYYDTNNILYAIPVDKFYPH